MQRQFSKISGNRLLCLHPGCIRSIRTMFVEQVILDAVKDILKNSSSAVQNSVQKTNNLQIEMLDRTIKDINTKIKQLNSQNPNYTIYWNRVFMMLIRFWNVVMQSLKKSKIQNSLRATREKIKQYKIRSDSARSATDITLFDR